MKFVVADVVRRGRTFSPLSLKLPKMGSIRHRPPSLSTMTTLFVLLLSLLSLTQAAKEGEKPQLSHTLFDNLPSRIMYFEDSPVSKPSFVQNRGGRGERRRDDAASWTIHRRVTRSISTGARGGAQDKL